MRREIGKKTLDVFTDELLCRYNDDKFVTSQGQLISENPDLEEKIGLLIAKKSCERFV